MAIAVKTIRQRVSAAVDAVTGFSESKQPHGVFGRDPASVLHKRYAVGCPRTTTVRDRQSLADGALVRTVVSVTYAHRVKPKDQQASYDDALDAEAAIIVAVMADSGSLQELQLSLSGIPVRQVDTAGEWIVGDIEFSSMHLLALT